MRHGFGNFQALGFGNFKAFGYGKLRLPPDSETWIWDLEIALVWKLPVPRSQKKQTALWKKEHSGCSSSDWSENANWSPICIDSLMQSEWLIIHESNVSQYWLVFPIIGNHLHASAADALSNLQQQDLYQWSLDANSENADKWTIPLYLECIWSICMICM